MVGSKSGARSVKYFLYIIYMKKIEVVAGIIYNNNGEVLCTQRNISPLSYISKKYEFPGGKIESKETHHEALQREIFEEFIDLIVENKGSQSNSFESLISVGPGAVTILYLLLYLLLISFIKLYCEINY